MKIQGFDMMDTITITKQQARQFLISYHGLQDKRTFAGKQGILSFIRKVGCIQFDPLNIVGHNHELVLQSRIKDFSPYMLQNLLYKERKLIDGWDKNMSIYLTEDWSYFNRSREDAKDRLGNESRPICKVLYQIRKAIDERGPLSSGDLDYQETVNWSWAPTSISRAALESMYFWGELVIHHKEYTRRIYDFASRHIPKELLYAPDPNKTEAQFYDWYVLRRIGAVGMLWNKAGDAWLGIKGLKSKERNESFSRLLEEGSIIEIVIEDVKHPMYIKAEDKQLLYITLVSRKTNMHVSFLAPLDNLMWDRKLIKELFAFDYVWEVYKPASQRIYGYYILPVLYGDIFIGRFEPLWDKKTRKLIIKTFWWEPEVKRSKKMMSELRKCFEQFSHFLGAEDIVFDDKALLRELNGG